MTIIEVTLIYYPFLDYYYYFPSLSSASAWQKESQ